MGIYRVFYAKSTLFVFNLSKHGMKHIKNNRYKILSTLTSLTVKRTTIDKTKELCRNLYKICANLHN